MSGYGGDDPATVRGLSKPTSHDVPVECQAGTSRRTGDGRNPEGRSMCYQSGGAMVATALCAKLCDQLCAGSLRWIRIAVSRPDNLVWQRACAANRLQQV